MVNVRDFDCYCCVVDNKNLVNRNRELEEIIENNKKLQDISRKQINDFKDENEALIRENLKLTEFCRRLQEDDKELKERIEDNKKMMCALIRQTNELQDELKKWKKSYQEKIHENLELHSENTRLEAENKKLKSKIATLKRD